MHGILLKIATGQSIRLVIFSVLVNNTCGKLRTKQLWNLFFTTTHKEKAMIITDWVHTIAGFFILLSLALGVEASPLFHHPYWLFLTAFVGANLFQFGFTKFCPLAMILKSLGVSETRCCSSVK
jgi:hypothetical protein